MGTKAFNNFRVVPPGTGICHQVNLEYLAKTVWTKKIKEEINQKLKLIQIQSSALTVIPQ